MVGYYLTLRIYGERTCLQKLEEFCKERGLTFELSTKFDSDSYAEYREEAMNELGFTNGIFRGNLTFKNARNYERVLAELDERTDINICIKMDW